jgi:hypothetical protein
MSETTYFVIGLYAIVVIGCHTLSFWLVVRLYKRQARQIEQWRSS